MRFLVLAGLSARFVMSLLLQLAKELPGAVGRRRGPPAGPARTPTRTGPFRTGCREEDASTVRVHPPRRARPGPSAPAREAATCQRT